MIQLTYISSAVGVVTERDVDGILEQSRRNNRAAGITGLLLYDGRRFMQVLEGEPGRVEAAYHRITADPRHRAIVMLSSSNVTSRAFDGWAMAAKRVGLGETVPDQIDKLTSAVQDANLRETFRSFARVRAAA
jgi:hypothetical protein